MSTDIECLGESRKCLNPHQMHYHLHLMQATAHLTLTLTILCSCRCNCKTHGPWIVLSHYMNVPKTSLLAALRMTTSFSIWYVRGLQDEVSWVLVRLCLGTVLIIPHLVDGCIPLQERPRLNRFQVPIPRWIILRSRVLKLLDNDISTDAWIVKHCIVFKIVWSSWIVALRQPARCTAPWMMSPTWPYSFINGTQDFIC